MIDHTGKSAMRGSSPIGAHHKIAMVQGTALQAHPVTQPMRGHRGEVQLLIYKDRPGAVRATSAKGKPQLAATVVLDSTVEGITRVEVQPPDLNDVVIGDTDEAVSKAAAKVQAAAARAEAAERKVREAERAREEWHAFKDDIMFAFDGDLDKAMSRSDLIEAFGPDRKKWVESNLKRAVDELVSAGLLAKMGSVRWTTYSLIGE